MDELARHAGRLKLALVTSLLVLMALGGGLATRDDRAESSITAQSSQAGDQDGLRAGKASLQSLRQQLAAAFASRAEGGDDESALLSLPSQAARLAPAVRPADQIDQQAAVGQLSSRTQTGPPSA